MGRVEEFEVVMENVRLIRCRGGTVPRLMGGCVSGGGGLVIGQLAFGDSLCPPNCETRRRERREMATKSTLKSSIFGV